MKKWIVFLLAALLLAGCGSKKAEEPTVPESAFDFRGYDWVGHLCAEHFDTSTDIGTAVRDAVEIRVEEATSTQIQICVEAPVITQTLLTWYDQVDDSAFSEEAMEDQILSLLSGSKTTYRFTLPYTVLEDLPILSYPQGFSGALGCGLTEFYDTLYDRILNQMEEDVSNG